MSVLEVRLLGPPTVRWAGRSLPILRRQTRILLYRLAVLGQALPREHLCFLFWPDVPESQASRNLSHLLTHLRSALPVAEALATYDDRVDLDPKMVWSDTQEFARLCCLSNSDDCIETLQHAVQLYRGPFLEGVSLASNPEFEAWMLQGRRTWEDRYLETLSTLISKQTIAGEVRAATANAQRYLAVDHLDEAMHRRLIELHTARGDRSAALNQYQHCATLLERELGVQPLPETQAAYQTVLHGEVLEETLAVTRPVWTTLPGPHAPLVGRQDILSILRQAYVRASSGKGGIVLIAGEAGMGKSRILQHFAAQLQDQALTLVAAGQLGTQTLPYQLIIQSLRSQITMIGRASETIGSSQYGLSAIWLAEVARLLPELNIICPGLPLSPPLQADEARSRLFEALTHLVHALATVVRPAFLCLDNLAWSDNATLDWLAYLGPRLRRMPLLIVGSYRSDEGDRLADLRQGYRRLGILTELELVGLEMEEVSELTDHVVQTAVCEKMVRRLYHATAGNPFFVLQILRKLMESGEKPSGWHNLEDFPLPATISAAINARLQSLDPVTRQVMEACAILAPVFGFDLARLTSGRRELETLDSLDLLENLHLLDEDTDQYRFHHDLVRRVVEANMSPMRRQLLHRRAGRALEQTNRQEVATLAYHYEAGNELVKAVHYHELAAQRAETLFAWREAEEHRGRVRALQLH